MSIPVENIVWASTPDIVKAVVEAPARNPCSPDRAVLVAAYLAFRMKDAKGYVDDAVAQITGAVGFDAKRTLTVLNLAGIWVVVRHGNQRSSSWRAPGPVLTARGAQVYRADESAGGAQRPPADESAGGREPSARGREGSARGRQVSPSTPVPHHVPLRPHVAVDESPPAPASSAAQDDASRGGEWPGSGDATTADPTTTFERVDPERALEIMRTNRDAERARRDAERARRDAERARRAQPSGGTS